MIEIVTADDHELIRFGLRRALEKTEDIRVAAEAVNGRQLLETLRQNRCDVLLLDISMPGIDIFDLIQEIRYIAPKTPILILTIHSESQYAVRLIRAGVAGYLKKSCAFNEIISAIRQVYSGKKYITPEVAEILSEYIDAHSRKLPHERLTTREYQVMFRIATGKTVSEIALELDVSVKTISTHRRNILQKMNLRNNAQLMQYAMDKKLV